MKKNTVEQVAECWDVHARLGHSYAYALCWTSYVFLESLSLRERVRIALVLLGLPVKKVRRQR